MKPIAFGSLERGVLGDEDRRMLSRLIQRAMELTESDDETEAAKASGIDVRAFEDMIGRNRPLSAKQRAWVAGVYEKMFDEPQYQNLASSGRLVVGRPVALPKVLLPENLPKKPPGRM